jgi:hypothetical protein
MYVIRLDGRTTGSGSPHPREGKVGQTTGWFELATWRVGFAIRLALTIDRANAIAQLIGRSAAVRGVAQF